MLRQRLKFALILFIFFLLQYSFFHYFRYQESVPDLLAIAVVFYAFYKQRGQSVLFAFLIGMFKDLFSYEVFGLQAVCYAGSVFSVSYLISNIPQEMNLFRVLTLFLFSSINAILLALALTLSDSGYHFFSVFANDFLPSICYTTFLSLFIFPLMKLAMKNELRQYNLF